MRFIVNENSNTVYYELFVFVQSALALEHRQIENDTDDQFEVIEISNLNQLRLFLKKPQTNEYYKSFDNIQYQLKSCEQLTFAMNGGMFHSGFSPVGLYIEQGQEIQPLNQDKGWGTSSCSLTEFLHGIKDKLLYGQLNNTQRKYFRQIMQHNLVQCW